MLLKQYSQILTKSESDVSDLSSEGSDTEEIRKLYSQEALSRSDMLSSDSDRDEDWLMQNYFKAVAKNVEAIYFNLLQLLEEITTSRIQH